MTSSSPSNLGRIAALALLPAIGLAGCLGPDLNAAGEPDPRALQNPARAAAIEDIRQRAATASAAEQGYPFVFDSPATPAGPVKSAREVKEAEQGLLAAGQSSAASVGAAEVAAMQDSALRLRRLGAGHVAETQRAIEAESAAAQ
ncbi:hypothetical protein ACUN0C_13955 [Faunimonas sp. B44]|uniref:hypothetical protein n=1 Tax=Faunimonas sp. B44 TaxID=3461493 RepID=UPI0040448A38